MVIDRAFSNVRGLQTVRKDSSSKFVAKRKNRKRARKERTKIGRKLDGIFRTYDDDIEYGAIEVKSEFVQVNSTDRLKDGLKLGKAMHDMFVCLSHLVELDEKKRPDNCRLSDFSIQVLNYKYVNCQPKRDMYQFSKEENFIKFRKK